MDDKRSIAQRVLEGVLIVFGGGVLLLFANLFIPSLSPLISIVIGILAVSRIFLAPGQLSWRRDISLFVVVTLFLAFAWFGKLALCEVTSLAAERCARKFSRGEIFISGIALMLPLMLYWSWIRFRILKHKVARK